MNQQTKYIIIGAVVIILIGLGVFYYQKNREPSVVIQGNTDTSGEDQVPIPIPITTPEPEVITPKPLTKEEIKTKFNAVMDQARLAFRNKDYPQSITYYKQALTYQNTDTPYSGMFIVYGAQGDWVKAQVALDSAIKINPLFVDYWMSKIGVMNEKTSASYEDLKKFYNEGLTKVDPAYKVNLVVFFAGVAESSGQISEAISLWQYAQTVFPDNKDIYQKEIERLQKMQ